MIGLREVGAVLRAVWQPVPGPLNPAQPSRSINEAISRLTSEAGRLTAEIAPAGISDALDDIARNR